MMSPAKIKSVSLTFRGFDVEPDMVEQLMGVKASLLGRKGSPVKPGVKIILSKSFVEFSVDFNMKCRLDEMIPALFKCLGGVENISMVNERISPEFFELNFILPIKYSDDQEGGFIPHGSIADVFKLGCSMSFEFI